MPLTSLDTRTSLLPIDLQRGMRGVLTTQTPVGSSIGAPNSLPPPAPGPGRSSWTSPRPTLASGKPPFSAWRATTAGMLEGELTTAELEKPRYRLLLVAGLLPRGGRWPYFRIAATRPSRSELARAFSRLAALSRPATAPATNPSPPTTRRSRERPAKPRLRSRPGSTRQRQPPPKRDQPRSTNPNRNSEANDGPVRARRAEPGDRMRARFRSGGTSVAPAEA
jgi:hypothetical protein